MNIAVLVLSVVFASVKCVFRPRGRTFPIPIYQNTGKPLFLTPFIETGAIDNAQHLSRVTPDIGNSTSYSGYLTTNKKCGNNLFFWFFPAQEDWKSAPLILWLEGGLGSSSMFSLFEEIGPFNSFRNRLQPRNYSWNVKNNLLFIDHPVGTGYSFTEKNCFAKNESDVVEDLYPALVQFLLLFPELQRNNFYLMGESFAGHYIPAIGYSIHRNNLSAQLKINLKGMMIGGGWFDAASQINYGDYLYQIGLIDGRQRQQFYYFQNKFLNQVNSMDWRGAYKTWFIILDRYEAYTGASIYNHLPQIPDKSNWDEFIQKASTRRAVHVGSKHFRSDSELVFSHLIKDTMHSVKPWVEILLDNNYPIVFYVGQLDVICGYPMAVNFLRSLNWTGQHLYLNATRSKWVEDGKVAGYVKGQRILFDVLVRGAGHMVAKDQPFWTFQLVNAFTMGQLSGRDFLSYLHPHFKSSK